MNVCTQPTSHTPGRDQSSKPNAQIFGHMWAANHPNPMGLIVFINHCQIILMSSLQVPPPKKNHSVHNESKEYS